MTNFLVRSPEETEVVGRQVAAYILKHKLLPSVLLLSGEIGAGKTVFTRGLAQGLGIKEPILSPTFPILLEYPSPIIPLYHFDLYRLADAEEFELIGGEEILVGHGAYGPGVSVLEWPERLNKSPDNLLSNLQNTLEDSSFPCFRVQLSSPQDAKQRNLLLDVSLAKAVVIPK